MSTTTQARPAMHRLHIHRTDGELTQDSTHDDHFVTATAGMSQRARRLREMGRAYSIDGMALTYVDPDGFTYTLTYEDVTA